MTRPVADDLEPFQRHPAFRWMRRTFAMPPDPTDHDMSMEFIRLLFADPVEEEIAHRWATRLALLIGPQALDLRPETTLREMLRWAATAQVDSIDFTVVFEPELRMAFAEFLDCSNDSTFRAMVQHYAGRFRRY